jgi:hypothetical protein
MPTSHTLLAVALAGALSVSQQGWSTLTPLRCANPTTRDSTASIHVSFDPPGAYSSSVSLTLHLVRQQRSDSLVAQPPFGVDSIAHVPAGLYRLAVRQIGYYHPHDTLRVAPGDAWCVTAHMVRDTVQLTPVH